MIRTNFTEISTYPAADSLIDECEQAAVIGSSAEPNLKIGRLELSCEGTRISGFRKPELLGIADRTSNVSQRAVYSLQATICMISAVRERCAMHRLHNTSIDMTTARDLRPSMDSPISTFTMPYKYGKPARMIGYGNTTLFSYVVLHIRNNSLVRS